MPPRSVHWHPGWGWKGGRILAPIPLPGVRQQLVQQRHPPSAPASAPTRFTAREQGATEQQLQQIAADGLARTYFRADNSRAHGLVVEFTDVKHIKIEL
ncbi:hypothetical protein AB0F36_35335 [Streptomyces sp. NPDC029080]|uniref:hypothetical protein n=1 Tax=Streptomyces sp. NPDC029080 TaxID=3155017 RepID=UPI0033CA7AAD